MDRLKKIVNSVVNKGFSINSFNRYGSRASFDSWEDQLNQYKGWVYPAVNAIAEEVATFEPQVKQRTADGYEIIPNHPLTMLLKNPNNKQSSYEFFYLLALQLNITGNAFVLIPTEVTAQPNELVPLSSARMTIETSGEDPVYAYRTLNGGSVQKFSYGEIIHFKKIDPANFNKGKSPVQALAGLLESENKAIDFQLSVFDNKAVLGGLLTAKNPLNPEQQEKVKDQLAQYSGSSNAGSTMILSGTEFNWQPMSATSSDLQLPALRNYNMRAILAGLRVPPSIVGNQDNSNRATAEANRFVFLSQVIRPQMRMVADSISHNISC